MEEEGGSGAIRLRRKGSQVVPPHYPPPARPPASLGREQGVKWAELGRQEQEQHLVLRVRYFYRIWETPLGTHLKGAM